MPINHENKQIRILFTSVGRRVELMQAFKAAARELGVDFRLYGADISDSAPALFFCDRQEIVCRISSPEYIPTLLSLCERESIDALIPTIDTDLLLLARERERFAAIGTRVVISAEAMVALCRDKRFTADFFISCGLKSPVPTDDYTKYDGGFPCFIKPKDGSSSVNAYRVDSADRLSAYADQVDDYIVQPYIRGDEYTVDIFCDFDGQPVYITPRRRLAVRSGEVIKTTICRDARITDECLALISHFRPCGAITVQLIRQQGTGDDYYIEINPRYGGGAPLSMKAGADSARGVLRLLMGERLVYCPDAAADGLIYSRFDQSVCVGGTPVKATLRAVIFDLDDTLYPEKAYVRGGFAAAAARLPQVSNAAELLWEAFSAGKPAIDTVLQEAGMYTPELSTELLTAYRQHTPELRLYPGVRELLTELRAAGIKLGIITDGRPEGQRAKLHALGLERLVDEIIVTDELGGAVFRKPNDVAFRIMQGRMGVDYPHMIYIGDNPAKDFHAPVSLGMQAGFFRNSDGIYYNRYSSNGLGSLIRTVTDIAQLRELLCGRAVDA